MEKAIAYYRVSRKKQEASGLGLEAQRYAVEGFAKINRYKIINDFVETESGKRNERPGLKAALKECQLQNATLLIAKLDRLSRSVAFIAALIESKVAFKAIDAPFAEPFTLHILAAVAEKERKDTAYRTVVALAAAKRRGVQLGKYSAVLAKKNKQLSKKFAHRMKPVIKELQARGINTIRAITMELNKAKVPTYRNNNCKWHLATVCHLMQQINNR